MATANYTIGSSAPIFNRSHSVFTFSTLCSIDNREECIDVDVPIPPEPSEECPPQTIRCVTTIFEDYTATNVNHYIFADATAGDITITLPPLADSDGLVFTIVKDDTTANLVIIDGYGTELIDTAETQTLSVPNSVLDIVGDFDGPRWKIV
jgi:hypothetical protein